MPLLKIYTMKMIPIFLLAVVMIWGDKRLELGEPELRTAKVILLTDDYICSESQWVYLHGFKSWITGNEVVIYDSVFVPRGQHKIEMEAELPCGIKCEVLFSRNGPSSLNVALEPDSTLVLNVDESDGEYRSLFLKKAKQGTLHNWFHEYYKELIAWRAKLKEATALGAKDSIARYYQERLSWLKQTLATTHIPPVAVTCIASLKVYYPEVDIKEVGKEISQRFPWYKGIQEDSRLIRPGEMSEDARKASRRLRELNEAKLAYGLVDKEKGARLSLHFKDKDGNEMATDDIRTPYVFVDFWASWCKPCRKEVPGIKQAAGKYAEELTVYAVSLDTKRDAWQQAIEADGTQGFVHLIGTFPNGNQTRQLQKLGIRAIPANFLLDKDRRIIAKDLRGEQLMQVLDSLVSK